MRLQKFIKKIDRSIDRTLPRYEFSIFVERKEGGEILLLLLLFRKDSFSRIPEILSISRYQTFLRKGMA